MPTTTYVSYAKISQFLAADDISRNYLYRGVDFASNLSLLIEITRKAVEWKNGIDSTDESINDTSLYLYDLCGKYIREAKRILNIGASGEIINPSTGNQVTIETPFVQFRVGDVGSPMTAGEDTLTLNYTGVVNPSVEITLDGTELPYGDPNQISYTATYSPTNVEIVFNQPVANSQLYMIHLIRLVNV